tara:strand:- start:2289 stop:3872 length:1584 start_codon:yes stop_codon:yes gene_type:complete
MARAPMPAPQPLESPAVRRSALLAKLLEEQRQPVEIKGGYGELAARLLAQGITQYGANKADKAVRTEREQRINSQRDALLANLPPVAGAAPSMPAPSGPALAAALSPPPVNNTQEPVRAQIAPAASAVGSPMPPAAPAGMPAAPMPMADVPPVQAPPAPIPQAAPMAPAPQPAPAAANPLGPTPQEIALIRQAATSGDPGQMAWAQQTWGEIQMRMATPPEINIQVGPDGTPYNTNDPSTLNRRFRNVENINGFLVDTNDPNAVGAYRPDLEPGEEPVYDRSGNIVGVRNLSGAIQARGERGRADADAQNASRASYAGAIAGNEAAARAPYQFVNVQSPTGAPITMSAASAAGGVFQGQTPADAIRAEGAARGEVEAETSRRTRASAALRVLPTLDNMERLLPDVIAGYGADQRLDLARATAGVNADARRRAAATQTFQNEARQVVSGILPMFGANPTEGERKYAEQMSGADVNYTPEALQEGINLARARAAREAVAADMPISPRLARTLPRGTEFIGEDGQRYRVP